MNTNCPDSFYLVCVDKPGAGDVIESKWQAWNRFLDSLERAKEKGALGERLCENLFLFHSKSNVLSLNRFLELCKKEGIVSKVFFLPQKPEPCE